MFDIVLVRWLNTILILVAFIYIHVMSKKTNNFYLGVPLLTWLFQALMFYLVFFLYSYGVFEISISEATHLFSYWSSISKFLGLITLFIYLYYIQHSCKRGNGKL